MHEPKALSYAPPIALPHRRTPLLAISLVWGTIMLIVAGVLVGMTVYALWGLVPGTPIRPMALAAVTMEVGGISMLISVVIAFVVLCLGARNWRHWVSAMVFLAVGPVPFVAAIGTLWLIVNVHGLILEG